MREQKLKSCFQNRQSSKSTFRFKQLFMKYYFIGIDIQIYWFDNWHNLPNLRKSVRDIYWQNAETTNFFPVPNNFWEGVCCIYVSLHRDAPFIYTLWVGLLYLKKKIYLKNYSIKAPICQWVSLCFCLFVCLFPNSSKTVNPSELKFGGMIPLEIGKVLG